MKKIVFGLITFLTVNLFAAVSTEGVFEFVQNPSPRAQEGALVVPISKELFNKTRVLSRIATRLSFPSYFDDNFDSFEECLGDLSWLPAGTKVVLVHTSLPTSAYLDDQKTYLNILFSVTQHARLHGSPNLSVVFDEKDKEMVENSIEPLDK